MDTTPRINGLAETCLYVEDVDRSAEFYQRVLGMEPVTFGDGRRALAFGGSKINLHQAGREFEPKAARPTPGSADLCLISADPLADVRAHREHHRILHRLDRPRRGDDRVAQFAVPRDQPSADPLRGTGDDRDLLGQAQIHGLSLLI